MKNNVLVLIDIQKEYTTPGRPFYLEGIEKSLENCSKILSFARQQHWEMIHVRHIKEGASIFDAESVYSDFDDRFLPIDGEPILTKHLYSCYSNQAFSEKMDKHQNDAVYLIGYNSIMCCLSTIIEGYHKHHKLTFVTDASLAKSTDKFSEADMHAHSVSIIQTAGYASLITTEDLLLHTLRAK